MKTDQRPIFALCILLALPITAGQCSSTFMRNVMDLHKLKRHATPAVQNFVDGKITGNSLYISSYFPAVSLDDVNSVNDFGCNTDIKTAHVFKLQLMRGDSSRFFIRNGGVVDRSWQTREIDSGATCPGVVVKDVAALNERCTKPGFFLRYDNIAKPMDLLIILQPTSPEQEITLWWSYTPNPSRQVDTCHLAKNGVCDYDLGKCLMGTDCSDCGGSNCQETECISAYEFSEKMDIPATCDDPEWASLPATRTDIGSKGPWDCQSLEREMRLDCSGCRCELRDPCTEEVKSRCRASNRELCARGSSECGECLRGYKPSAKTAVCEPNPCDDAAKEACRKANKETCSDDFHCGGCLPGFGKVSDICVDVSQCITSDVPSRMVMLMDTSGSLDNPLHGGRYGNFREMKNLAMDLINVFPINQFAIRSFSTDVTPYPASGIFVGKSEARAAVESMSYDNQVTRTGEALEHTIKLLEDKTDSFNIVVVLTDGKATDGLCEKEGETCDLDTGMCSGGQHSCKLLVQAPRLKKLPDRNGTVTVVSVGFGQIDTEELRLIASGDGDDNTVIAQGSNASAGLAALHNLLGSLVEKVCLNLPVDCVVGYTDWSECPDECGEQYQFKEKQILVEAKNCGKPCPDSKQMLIRRSRACPQATRCTTANITTTITTTITITTTTTTTITTTATTTRGTTTTATTPVPTTAPTASTSATFTIAQATETSLPGLKNQEIILEFSKNVDEVNSESINMSIWALVSANFGVTILFS